MERLRDCIDEMSLSPSPSSSQGSVSGPSFEASLFRRSYLKADMLVRTSRHNLQRAAATGACMRVGELLIQPSSGTRDRHRAEPCWPAALNVSARASRRLIKRWLGHTISLRQSAHMLSSLRITIILCALCAALRTICNDAGRHSFQCKYESKPPAMQQINLIYFPDRHSVDH